MFKPIFSAYLYNMRIHVFMPSRLNGLCEKEAMSQLHLSSSFDALSENMKLFLERMT